MSIKRLYTATLRCGKKDNEIVIQLVLFKWKDKYGVSDSTKLSNDLTVETIKNYPYKFIWHDDIISGLLDFRKGLAEIRSKLSVQRYKELKLSLSLEKTKLVKRIESYAGQTQEK
jgi:hypothetical protein